MHIALFAGLMMMIGFTGVSSQSTRYDTEVPQRCATVQDRYDVRNTAFCQAWTAEHKVKKEQEEQ